MVIGVRPIRNAVDVDPMARALVVVGEPLVRGAELERAGRDLDQLEAGRRRTGRRRRRLDAPAGVVVAHAREHERLQHRLLVLVLVADHELVQQAVADAAGLGQLAHARAHLGQVLVRLGAPQVGEIAALPARRLEGVVDLGEVPAQHRLAAEAVHEPQVLEGGDVPEVPHQRAHQLRVHALEVLGAHRLHQREGPLARHVEAVEEGVGVGRRGGGCGGGRHLVAFVPCRVPVLRGSSGVRANPTRPGKRRMRSLHRFAR